MSVRGVISRADKSSGNKADKVYRKEVATRKPEIQKRHLCTISFFCFVKVMEKKTDIASYFSIVMKVDVWLRICLHGKDAANMF